MKFSRIQFTKATCAVLMVPWLLASLMMVSVGCKTKSGLKYSIPHPVLSLAEFKVYVESHKFPILDARDPESYNAGHVPGAISFPSADFPNRYEQLRRQLDRYKKNLVIVYCGDQWCGLADNLQTRLIACGFQHVASFPGGWLAWQQAKLPEEKNPVNTIP